MKKYIKTVTITGASDDTSQEEMREVQQKYPFVEWGILVSRYAAGRQKRFPSMDWVNQLDSSLNLSAHLCGGWVDEILLGEVEADLRHILNMPFKRVQINTHGIPHQCASDLMQVLHDYRNTQFIFQYDIVNKHIAEHAIVNGYTNISALHDLSHGAGVLPEKWDGPLDIYTGYAGGLSPANLEEQLQRIDEVVGDKHIWIDAETHLRTDEYLDWELVIPFLEAAKSRVVA
jgi:hypothetical protein